MGEDRSAARSRGSSLVVGGQWVEVAQRLAEQAQEIRRAADLMEMVARLGSQVGSSPRALSEAMAHALIDVRTGEKPAARQAGGVRPGPCRGRDGGKAGTDAAATDVIAPPRRLWKDTPLVVVQAATARSYGRSVLCALGITPDGRKRVLGYRWETTSMQASAGSPRPAHGPSLP